MEAVPCHAAVLRVRQRSRGGHRHLRRSGAELPGERRPAHARVRAGRGAGSHPADRSYTTLSVFEHDAFMARIWAGIHFRDAIEYATIAHKTVHRVERILD